MRRSFFVVLLLMQFGLHADPVIDFIDLLNQEKVIYQHVIAHHKIKSLMNHIVLQRPQVLRFTELCNTIENDTRATIAPLKSKAKEFITKSPESGALAFLLGFNEGLPWVVDRALKELLKLSDDVVFSNELWPIFSADKKALFKTVFADCLYVAVKKQMNLIVKKPTIEAYLQLGDQIFPEMFDGLVELVLVFANTPVGKHLLGETFAVAILNLIATSSYFPSFDLTIAQANKLKLWGKCQPNVPSPLLRLVEYGRHKEDLFGAFKTLSSSDMRHLSQHYIYGNKVLRAILYNQHYTVKTKISFLRYLREHYQSSLNEILFLGRRSSGGSAYHKLCRLIPFPGSVEEIAVARLIAADLPTKKTLQVVDSRGLSLLEYARSRSLFRVLHVLEKKK